MIVGHGEGPRGLKYSIYCGRKISFSQTDKIMMETSSGQHNPIVMAGMLEHKHLLEPIELVIVP